MTPTVPVDSDRPECKRWSVVNGQLAASTANLPQFEELVTGAIVGADGRKKVLRLGCAATGASGLLPSSKASLNFELQLWHSLPASRKTQTPRQ
jgi:hypothetical protein